MKTRAPAAGRVVQAGAVGRASGSPGGIAFRRNGLPDDWAHEAREGDDDDDTDTQRHNAFTG